MQLLRARAWMLALGSGLLLAIVGAYFMRRSSRREVASVPVSDEPPTLTAEPRLSQRRDGVRRILLVLAVALAVMGQLAFARGKLHPGLILYGLSLPLSVYALAGHGSQAGTQHGPRRTRQSRRSVGFAVLVAAALLLEIGVLWLDRAGSLSEADAFPLYSLSVALFATAFLVLDGSLPPLNPPRARGGLRGGNRWEIAALGFVLLVTLALRLYGLDAMPPGFWGDEGNDGMEALQVLSGDLATPFRNDWGGNPALKTFVNALAVRLLGRNQIAIRGVAAVFGSLSVLVCYLLTRQLFSLRVALLASFMLAVSRWHIHRSRFDSVVIEGAFFQIVAFYFLFRGLRRRQVSDFAWAGLAIGLGLNSYHGARIAPFVVAAVVAHQTLFRRTEFLKQYYRAFAALVLGAAVMFAPLGLYYAQHKNTFAGRARSVWLFNNRSHFQSMYPGEHSDLEMLALQSRDTLLMFNYRGDGNPTNNWGRRPMLDFVTGVLFVSGVGYSLVRWRDRRHIFLLSWLALTFLAGSVLTVGAPQSARTSSAIPALCIEAALFLDAAWEAMCRESSRRWNWSLAGIVLAALGISAYFNMDVYFNNYMKDRGTWHAFGGIVVQVADYIKSLGPEARVHFLASSGINRSNRGLQFLSGGFDGKDFWDPTSAVPAREGSDRGIVYIFPDSSMVPLLRHFYPKGIARRFQDPFGAISFVGYEVHADELATSQGLIGRYYAGDSWEGVALLARRDGPIAFDWDRDAPVGGPFSVVWEGTLHVPQSGGYDFWLNTSGTVKLFVDGTSVIAAEEAMGPVGASAGLASGLHAVVLRYARSGASGGWIQWNWIGPGVPGGLVSTGNLHTAPDSRGLLGRYYSNGEWSGRPSSYRVDPYINFGWERSIDPLPGPFSVEWEGLLEVDRPGTYAFATNSSNGSWLYVDDHLVVDNGGDHGMRYKKGTVDLEAGQHGLALRYVYTSGRRAIQVFWTPPGGSEEIVPPARLRPSRDGLLEVVIGEPATVSARPLLIPPPRDATAETPWSYVTGWGASGRGSGQFSRPQDVAVSPGGDVYVVDTGNHRVQRFDSFGRFLGTWGSGGEQPGQFLEPWAIALNSQGDVYVLDSGAGRVDVFTPQGQYLKSVGENSGFYSPRDVAVDGQGNVYVANTGGNQVVKLSPEGRLLAVLGEGTWGTHALNQPDGVAIDDAGNILAFDKGNSRLVKFDASGRALGEWPLAWANRDRGPRIAFGPKGEVYLLDAQQAQVWVYDRDERLLAHWDQQADRPGQLLHPTGLAMDGQGFVFVVDAGGDRVHKYRLDDWR